MLAGTLEIQMMADMSRLAQDMEKAKRLTGDSMMAMELSMGKVKTTIDAMAAAEKERASVFTRTFEETKRLLNIAKGAADDTAKSLADLKINPDALEIPDEAIQSLKTWQERSAYAIGAGAAAGWDKAKTAWDDFKGFTERQVVIWGVALAVGISAAVLGAVYAAFKGISFAVGLLTGESYKSANIDALVAMNKEVKTLQENLPTTAVGASALNEALKQQGTSATAYASTIGSVESAIRSNGAEMDRLGVKYKAQDGSLLTTNETLRNAAIVLSTYKEGWDRSQAAKAIGMGSEKEIQDALAITAEKTQIAKDRLVDYGLIIGEGTQESVKKYEDAMRAFERESDLTSQGFKRAIADNVMPILTDLAEFFRDGFPGAVMAFRYSFATVTSLFYGLKTVVFMVAESIVGSISAIGSVLGGLASAAGKALKGDFSGAHDALVQGWEDAKTRLGGIGDNIIAQAQNNSKAMAQAWGADSLGANEAAGSISKTGKAWEDAAKKVADVETAYDKFMKSVREKIALEEAEAEAGTKLTDAQKFQVELEAKLAEIIKTTAPAQTAAAEAIVAKAVALKAANAEQAVYAKLEAGMLNRAAEALDAQDKLTQSEIDGTKSMRDSTAEMLLTGDALLALKQARVDDEIAIQSRRLTLAASIDMEGADAVAIRATIAAMEDRKRAMGEKNEADKTLDAMKQQSDMWKSIDKTAHDTWVSIAHGGKDTATRLKESFKNIFFDFLYQMTIKKWLFNVSASVSGTGVAQQAFGSTGADSSGGGAGVGGWLQGASLMDKLSSGVADWTASAVSMGEQAGYWAARMTGASQASAEAMVEMGGQIGAASSYIGAGLAGISIGSAIAGDKKVLGMDGTTTSAIGAIIGSLVGGPLGGLIGGIAGGVFDAAFGTGPREYSGTTLQGKFNSQGFSGQYATNWSEEGGWFSSGDSGTDYAPVPTAQRNGLASLVGGTKTVFDAFLLATGGATRSLGNWSFAINRAVVGEEAQKQLVIDLSNSMGRLLVPELEALMVKGESFADTAVRMRDEFLLTDRIATLLGKDVATAFGKVGIASATVRDSLISLSGGMPQLSSAMQKYYKSFFSDQERHAIDLKALNTSIAHLGITNIPQTNAQFRRLMESQNLATSAGQQTFTALLNLSSAFDEVHNSAVALTADGANLENSFRTRVDFNRFQATGETGYTPGSRNKPGVPYDSETTAALARLREELQRGQIALAQYMSEMAAVLRRWNNDGMPEIRTVT